MGTVWAPCYYANLFMAQFAEKIFIYPDIQVCLDMSLLYLRYIKIWKGAKEQLITLAN